MNISTERLKKNFPSETAEIFAEGKAAGLVEGKTSLPSPAATDSQARAAGAADERKRLQEINALRGISPKAAVIVDELIFTGDSKGDIALKITESDACCGTEADYEARAKSVGAAWRKAAGIKPE